MALLPDLSTATILALVVFLAALGLLVVFVESIRAGRMAVGLVAIAAAAAGLSAFGEPGIGVVLLGLAAALLANHAFEWLTTR